MCDGTLSLSLFASGGPCQGGRLRAARANLSLSLSLSADCPSGQDPPEAHRRCSLGAAPQLAATGLAGGCAPSRSGRTQKLKWICFTHQMSTTQYPSPHTPPGMRVMRTRARVVSFHPPWVAFFLRCFFTFTYAICCSTMRRMRLGTFSTKYE